MICQMAIGAYALSEDELKIAQNNAFLDVCAGAACLKAKRRYVKKYDFNDPI